MESRTTFTAFVRRPGGELARCELTHLGRTPIDTRLAAAQHQHYVAVLRELGVRIEWLPPLPAHPDAVFVEDTALVLPEVAVITRPGALSRRAEVGSVAEALGTLRDLRRIRRGALDGGDVLRVGRTLFAGLSSRTDGEGVAALCEAVEEFGYTVRSVPVAGCLHLKTACTFIPPGTLVANRDWVAPEVFGTPAVVPADPREPMAGNTLTVAGTTLVSASCPLTRGKLEAAGIRTRAVDIRELHKAEAGLTCLSVIVES
jgi:dimethylargininase